jgi:UDP-N-acetyl-D-mannosaminuronic acid transferase (WecB/TagA/CpsF family)
LLVLNQWGTFDFRAGVQKRAPRLRRKFKVEWLWRRISDPKRNTKKIRDSLKIINYIFRYLLLKNK